MCRVEYLDYPTAINDVSWAPAGNAHHLVLAWFTIARSGALILNVCTLFSLRRGAASAARAARVPLEQISLP